MAELSKITLPSGTTYDLKDATARSQIEALGHPFQYEIVASLPTAAASTMYKIYLVASSSAEAGSYIEWLTLDKGASANPRYVWEQIGSTSTDLSQYAKTSDLNNYVPWGTTVDYPQYETISSHGHTHTVTHKNLSNTTKYLSASASGTEVGASSTSDFVTSYGGSFMNLVTTSVPNVTGNTATSPSKITAYTAGTSASCTLPSLSCEVKDETLKLTWSAGSFTANTPTSVTYTTEASSKVTLGTAVEVATGRTTAATSGNIGSQVMVGLGTKNTSKAVTGVSVTTQPTITLTANSSTATGRITYVESGSLTGGSTNTSSAGGHTHTLDSSFRP